MNETELSKIIAETISNSITLPTLHGPVLEKPVIRKRRHRKPPDVERKLAVGALFVTLGDGFLDLPIITDPGKKKGGGGNDGGGDGSGGGSGWNGTPIGGGGGTGGGGGGTSGGGGTIKPPPPPPNCSFFLVYRTSFQTNTVEKRRRTNVATTDERTTDERTTDVLPYTPVNNCLAATYSSRDSWNVPQITSVCPTMSSPNKTAFISNYGGLVVDPSTTRAGDNRVSGGRHVSARSSWQETTITGKKDNYKSYDYATTRKFELVFTATASGGDTIPRIKDTLIVQSSYAFTSYGYMTTTSFVDNFFDIVLSEVYIFCPNARTFTPYNFN